MRAGGVRQGGGGHGAQEKVHFLCGERIVPRKGVGKYSPVAFTLLLNKHHIKVILFQSYLLKPK